MTAHCSSWNIRRQYSPIVANMSLCVNRYQYQRLFVKSEHVKLCGHHVYNNKCSMFKLKCLPAHPIIPLMTVWRTEACLLWSIVSVTVVCAWCMGTAWLISLHILVGNLINPHISGRPTLMVVSYDKHLWQTADFV